jgi:hypothetical protein
MSGKGKGSPGSVPRGCEVAHEWGSILNHGECEDETQQFLKENNLLHFALLVRGWNISDLANMDKGEQDDFVDTIFAQAQDCDQDENTLIMLRLRDRNRWQRALKHLHLEQ